MYLSGLYNNEASAYLSVATKQFFGGTKRNDVIFNDVIIEMASSDNLSVHITGVLISNH